MLHGLLAQRAYANATYAHTRYTSNVDAQNGNGNSASPAEKSYFLIEAGKEMVRAIEQRYAYFIEQAANGKAADLLALQRDRQIQIAQIELVEKAGGTLEEVNASGNSRAFIKFKMPWSMPIFVTSGELSNSYRTASLPANLATKFANHGVGQKELAIS